MPSRADAVLRRPTVLLALWGATVALTAILVQGFWIPLDDGTLAQTAERILLGELPHRDFGDPYTGLNAMVGAVAFHFFGVSLASLRVPLVAAFALWIPALWLLARRFASPTSAVTVTLLAAALSIPAYPAAMPTWFGLVAATWGLWALLRFMDVGARRWLVAVGAAAAVSVLFKVTGVYFLAAALLTLLRYRSNGSPAYLGVAVLGVGLFLVLLGRLVLAESGVAGVYHFFLPGFVLCLAVLVGSVLDGADGSGGLGDLITDIAWLGVGVLAPLLLFLVPYAASGSVGAWVEGVFLLPARRFDSASSPPGDTWTILPGIVAVSVAWMGTSIRGVIARRVAIALLALLASGLALDDFLEGAVLAWLWYGARGWIPAMCVVAGWVSVRRQDVEGTAILAVAATAGLWALVQFPYAAPAYFFYVAPLGVLASAAAFRDDRDRLGPVLGVLAGSVAFLGLGYATGVAASATTMLDLDRGGIRVSAVEASMYRDLIGTVQTHADGGGLWAGPDAPEVYFLSGLPNPKATLYEFLDATPPTPANMERLLDDNDVRVVAVNPRPLFSAPLEAAVLELLERRFPRSRTVGTYIVRWKAP